MPSRLRFMVVRRHGERPVIGSRARALLRQESSVKAWATQDWARIVGLLVRGKRIYSAKIWRERRGIANKASNYHASMGRRNTQSPLEAARLRLVVNERLQRQRPAPRRERFGDQLLRYGGVRTQPTGHQALEPPELPNAPPRVGIWA